MSIQQTSSTAAAFAEALLQLADERKQVDHIAGEVGGLAEVLAETPGLLQFFASPSIKDADRNHVVESVLAPRFSPLVGSFLKLLSAKGKLAHLGDICVAFRSLLEAKQGKVDVDVTVARKLGNAELDLVRQRISTAIKKEANVRQIIDENILGGIVIRVGDTLIDGSVAAQLKAVEQKMLAS
jgi:F-type H+-transporting ATPase subunit delta